MQAYSISIVEEEVALARVMANAALNANQNLGGAFTAGGGNDGFSNSNSNSGGGGLFGGARFAEIGGSPPLSVSLSDPLFMPRQGTHVLTVRLCKAAPGLRVVVPSDGSSSGGAAAASTSSPTGRRQAGPNASNSSTSSSPVVPSGRSGGGGAATGRASAPQQQQQQQPRVIIVSTMEVVFPPHYPAEPCSWRHAAAGGTSSQTTVAGGLHPAPRGASNASNNTMNNASSASGVRSGTTSRDVLSPLQRGGAGSVSTDLLLMPVSPTTATATTAAAAATTAASSTAAAGAQHSLATPNARRPSSASAATPTAATPTTTTTTHVAYALLQPSAAASLLDWVARGRETRPLPDGHGYGGGNTGLDNNATLGGADSAAGRAVPPSIPPFLRDFVNLIKGWAAIEVDLRGLGLLHHHLHSSGSSNTHRGKTAAVGGGGGSSNTSINNDGGAGAVGVLSTAPHATTLPPWALYAAAAATSGNSPITATVTTTTSTATATAAAALWSSFPIQQPQQQGEWEGRTRPRRDARQPNRADPSRKATAVGGASGGGGGGVVGVSAGLGPSALATAPSTSPMTAMGGSTTAGGGSGGGLGLPPTPGGLSMNTATAGPAGGIGIGVGMGGVGRVGLHRGLARGDQGMGMGPGAVTAAAAGAPFATCFLPQGGVLAWGRPHPRHCPRPTITTTAAAVTVDGKHRGKHSAATATAGLLPPHVAAFCQSAAAPGSRGTALLFTSRFAQQRPLPSLVTPALVLRCRTGRNCRWSDVRLYVPYAAGNNIGDSSGGGGSSGAGGGSSGAAAHAALQANAKLCKALGLRTVASLFSALHRLVKGSNTAAAAAAGRGGGGSGGQTAPAYAAEVLAPVVERTLAALQAARQPFWSGVAVCCLVLPSALHGGGGASSSSSSADAFSVAPFLRDKAGCIAAVTLVERVFALVGAQAQRCEARLVRLALHKAIEQACLQPYYTRNSSSSSTTSAVVGRAHMPPGAVRHEPITHCAVCGLSLQRHLQPPVPSATAAGREEAQQQQPTVPPPASPLAVAYSLAASPVENPRETAAARHFPINSSGGGQRRDSSTAAVVAVREGCLVVQCLRCGHGGHVEHIAGWWRGATVRCCPKGCDCICIY